MIDGLEQLDTRSRASPIPRVTIVEQVARLCTNAFADLCAVYLRDSPGAPIVFCARAEEQYASLSEAALDDLYAERAREAGVTALLQHPLLVDGIAIGSVVLGSNGRSAPTKITPATAEAVASILATAIGQATQLAHHHRVSDRLQRAMLPEALIEADGMRFDAAYSPASREAEVGGDWYDAFDLAGGMVGISVGDVTGHGLEAAVAMSEIRRAIRVAATTYASPSAMIEAVEAMVSAQEIGMASAIIGIYDPQTGVLRYACAGHPHPALVTPSGDAYLLPGGGTLLGLGESASSPVHTITLAPGSTCYFYTDGLIEHHRDAMSGEEDLLAAVEAMAAEGRHSASTLHAKIIGGDGRSIDDCATLMLQRSDRSGVKPVERYTFSARPSAARLAREAIRHYAKRLGLTDEEGFDLLVAIGEAVANAIEYGNPDPEATFEVEALSGNGEVILHVESSGHWRTTPSQGDRGRGLRIMRACAREVEVSSTAERTRLTLAF
ncbi:MAG TPA: SpoIIE family protein phosphatase [Candidatus Baltobacteraceae bacterium]|nr:SpoIIE family protein phosphatase [Candidatus Baltobacteraceae bacterium]